MNVGVEERTVVEARGSATAAGLEIALIISVTERGDRVETVYEECRAAFAGTPYDPEIVLVAEPWTAGLLERFRARRDRGERVRLLRAGQTVGETVLIRSAVAVTPADLVITLPAYPRVDAAVLPVLVERVLSGADMAVAKRWPRHDSATNRFQTGAFHALLRRLTGSGLSDVACGVRAMRPELIERLPAYGDFGRFLPVLAARQGYRVVEVEAEQHELDRRARVYSPSVYVRRLLDVFGLYFLTRFMEKPLRFFGLVGGGLAGVGGLILAVLTVQRLQGQSLADRPMLLLGVLLLVLGVQAIALGLVGEIIVYLQAGRRKPYRLMEVVEDEPRGPKPPRG
jgi:hypothetical protein